MKTTDLFKKETAFEVESDKYISKSELETPQSELKKNTSPKEKKPPISELMKSSGYGKSTTKQTTTKSDKEPPKEPPKEGAKQGSGGGKGGGSGGDRGGGKDGDKDQGNDGGRGQNTRTGAYRHQNRRRIPHRDDPDGDDGDGDSDDSDVDLPGDFDDEAPQDRAFKRVSQGLRRIEIEHEEMEFIDDYLHSLGKTVCSFCSGRGHLPDTCASKKNLDILMRETGNAEEWGKLKNRRYGLKFRKKREAKKRFTRNN